MEPARAEFSSSGYGSSMGSSGHGSQPLDESENQYMEGFKHNVIENTHAHAEALNPFSLKFTSGALERKYRSESFRIFSRNYSSMYLAMALYKALYTCISVLTYCKYIDSNGVLAGTAITNCRASANNTLPGLCDVEKFVSERWAFMLMDGMHATIHFVFFAYLRTASWCHTKRARVVWEVMAMTGWITIMGAQCWAVFGFTSTSRYSSINQPWFVQALPMGMGFMIIDFVFIIISGLEWIAIALVLTVNTVMLIVWAFIRTGNWMCALTLFLDAGTVWLLGIWLARVRLTWARHSFMLHQRLVDAELEVKVHLNPFSVSNLKQWLSSAGSDTTRRASPLAHSQPHMVDAIVHNKVNEGDPQDKALPLLAATSHAPSNYNAPAEPTHPWEILRSNLSIGPKIGAGGSGMVYRGTMTTVAGGAPTKVALKQCVSLLMNPNDLNEFAREAGMLSGGGAWKRHDDHVFLVKFFGICKMVDAVTKRPKAMIVMEHCDMSLADLLLDPSLVPRGARMGAEDWRWLCLFGARIAAAVHWLHTANGVVHRDLKPENFLLQRCAVGDPAEYERIFGNSAMMVKIADFGLARSVASAANARVPAKVGTPFYMAPELVSSQSLKPTAMCKADMFALGVTLASMCTDNDPYAIARANKRPKAVMLDVAAHGLRPTVPANTPESLRETMAAAWDANPNKRPSATVLQDRLLNTLAELTPAETDRRFLLHKDDHDATKSVFRMSGMRERFERVIHKRAP